MNEILGLKMVLAAVSIAWLFEFFIIIHLIKRYELPRNKTHSTLGRYRNISCK